MLKIMYDELLVFIFIYYNFNIMLVQRTILYILKYHHVFPAELNQLKKSFSAHAPISFVFSLSARGVSESVRVKFHEY